MASYIIMELTYSKSFLETEISHYLAKGFGSYNKNDFEVLIFKALLEITRKAGMSGCITKRPWHLCDEDEKGWYDLAK